MSAFHEALSSPKYKNMRPLAWSHVATFGLPNRFFALKRPPYTWKDFYFYASLEEVYLPFISNQKHSKRLRSDSSSSFWRTENALLFIFLTNHSHLVIFSTIIAIAIIVPSKHSKTKENVMSEFASNPGNSLCKLFAQFCVQKKGEIPGSPHAICKALDFRTHTQCACAKVTSQNKSASLYKARIVVCSGSPPFCTRRKKWHVQNWCFEHDASKKGETHIRTQRAKNHWLWLWSMMQNDLQFTWIKDKFLTIV